MTAERDLAQLLATMEPVVRPGEFVFVSVAAINGLAPLATVEEEEGVSCVLTREEADRNNLPYTFVAAWVTLDVHSALDAVGFTAAVCAALANDGISCNVIAGSFHDHLLVPHHRAGDAMARLHDMSRRAR